jgi:hypothetical protein
LNVLAEALSLVGETREVYYQAKLFRLRGELLQIQGDEIVAEADFHRAIDLVR